QPCFTFFFRTSDERFPIEPNPTCFLHTHLLKYRESIFTHSHHKQLLFQLPWEYSDPRTVLPASAFSLPACPRVLVPASGTILF
uniref:Uncharacterized protein n=1 Tax=Accipiter nisus TaxID=211598 RepID=A0A8B9MYX4_9AVES